MSKKSKKSQKKQFRKQKLSNSHDDIIATRFIEFAFGSLVTNQFPSLLDILQGENM